MFDRATILATTSPRALFGDAVEDPLALRRAYAALAKQFRPEDDPEAFRHVRDLYEQARASPPSEEGPAPSADPIEILRQAVEQNQWQVMVDVLCAQTRLLLTEASELAGVASERLVVAVGPALGSQVVDTIELIARSPDLDLHPARAMELQEDVVMLRALRQASEDPEVDPALLLALKNCWYADAVRSAEALLEASQAVEDIDRTVRHICRQHPALWTQLSRADVRVTAAASWYASGGASLGTSLPGRLHRRLDVTRRDHLDDYMRWAARFVLIVLWVAISLTGVSLATRGLLTLVGSWAFVFGYWYGLRPHIRQGTYAELVDAAREHALFPHELVDALVDHRVASAHGPAFTQTNPLLVFEKSSTALLEVLTPAHVDRVRQRPKEAAP